MTATPPEPPEASTSPGAAQPPEAAQPPTDTGHTSAPTSALPAAAPAVAPPPYATPGPYQDGGAPAYPPPYAFAAVPRPPREPWVNPSKRAAVAVISVVAALVLLLVGAVVGHAVARHQDDRMGNVSIDHQNMGPFGRKGGPGYRQLPNQPLPNRQLPNPQRPNRNGPSSVPTATASAATPSPTATS